MKLSTSLLLAVLAAAPLSEASAFAQETHKRIAMDAVRYMQQNPGTTNYAKLLAGLTKAGYTVVPEGVPADQTAAIRSTRTPIVAALPATTQRSPATVTAVRPETGHPVFGLRMWPYRLPSTTTHRS